MKQYLVYRKDTYGFGHPYYNILQILEFKSKVIIAKAEGMSYSFHIKYESVCLIFNEDKLDDVRLLLSKIGSDFERFTFKVNRERLLLIKESEHLLKLLEDGE